MRKRGQKDFMKLPKINNRDSRNKQKPVTMPVPLHRIENKSGLFRVQTVKIGNHFIIRKDDGTSRIVKKITAREAMGRQEIARTASSEKDDWGGCVDVARKHCKDFYERVYAWRPTKPPRGGKIAIAFYERKKKKK